MAVALASLWGLLGGCRELATAPVDRNRAPETFLTSAPGDSQTTFYKVLIRWSGTDYDGAVVAFDIAVTESLPKSDDIVWRRTRRSDSLVIFPVEETREVLGHRFYVRAVDNEGKIDPTPAWVFFGARDNVPPQVKFRSAVAFGPYGEEQSLDSTNPDFPTDTIPTGWGVRFEWIGSDGDVMVTPEGRIEQVGRVGKFWYRLLPVETGLRGGKLTDTAAVYVPQFFLDRPKGSNYVFNVRAVDDAGLTGSGLAYISFVWNRDPVSEIQRRLRPGGVDSVASFESPQNGEIHYSGDTLPLPVNAQDLRPSMWFRGSAYDPDPLGSTHRVKSIEWRHSSGAGVFTMWDSLPSSGVGIEQMLTGDYIVMVRSIDGLDRVETTPDSMRFYVNLAPRFRTRADAFAFTQTPMPGDTFRLGSLAQGLPCKFWARNPDSLPNVEKIRYSYRFDGLGILYKTVCVRCDNLSPLEFIAKPPAPDTLFHLGSYKLRVRAEDNYQDGGDENRGRRAGERVVRFLVVP